MRGRYHGEAGWSTGRVRARPWKRIIEARRAVEALDVLPALQDRVVVRFIAAIVFACGGCGTMPRAARVQTQREEAVRARREQDELLRQLTDSLLHQLDQVHGKILRLDHIDIDPWFLSPHRDPNYRPGDYPTPLSDDCYRG